MEDTVAVSVYNISGAKLVEYTYDAWGNATIVHYNGGASTGATKNPFRYRGYYYDSDLGLYYLNTRYYDSVTGRFISADAQKSYQQGVYTKMRILAKILSVISLIGLFFAGIGMIFYFVIEFISSFLVSTINLVEIGSVFG